MVHRSTLRSACFAAFTLCAAACGGGSNVTNSSPRFTEVPQQATTGGTPFTLDLSTYVADREGATLTYAVTSGGGSFTGSSYTNTFDTMGEYTVEFTVTDGSKVTVAEFEVVVTSANFVVVREDSSGLKLLDSATNAFVQVAAATQTPVLGAGLSDGRLVYQLGNPYQLWIFDPMTRQATRLGTDSAGAVIYRAKTSDDKIVYTDGTSNDMKVVFHNPTTGVARQIAQGSLATVDVAVNDDDLVFYEVGASAQTDVWYYDPAEDESLAVGTAATDEQILAVLPNGACVFSRIGGGGETDLFYFRVGTGLVEIGTDVSALDTRNKTYNAYGSASQVVFTAVNGSNREVFAWNPATGQTATVASGADNVYDAIGVGNEVVYHTVVSGTEHDVYFYDLDSAVTATVRNNSDITSVRAVTSDGSTAWAILGASGTTSSLFAVSLVGTPATVTWAAGGVVATTVGVLDNGDVVGERSDGTALNVFDVSAGTWGTAITGTGLSFEGDGLAAGDFVYTVTAAAQTDLSMWDASATASVVVSNTVGADAFAALTSDGTILFTRVVAGNTNTDLFVWDGTTETRLTNTDAAGLLHSHTVLGIYAGSR
ncbi:MAG: hypothetical protein Q7T30_00030 [Planctomycetota bacterium]|nr:hypothetical protein [Planctomycetota bacterium]